MLSIVILISGRGSNMEAILKARLPIDIRAVIANRPDATGLQTAAAAGCAVEVVDHTLFPSRDAFDDALAACIDQHQPDVIVLAGFMRILGRAFIERYPNKILNIHPSLLPAFPGLHTHRQAIEAGVRIHGATVHIVTPELDAGPILAQVAVPVADDDNEESLAARVLRQEHVIYPAVLRRLAESSASYGESGVVLRGARRVEQLDASGEKLISL
jgi:phosphoribosylglycinamide formyltransferase 1